jgi:hypothetical protein
MVEILIPRRRFLTVLGGLIAAPMVMKASSLMRVTAIPDKIYRRRLPTRPFDLIVEGFDANGMAIREPGTAVRFARPPYVPEEDGNLIVGWNPTTHYMTSDGMSYLDRITRVVQVDAI